MIKLIFNLAFVSMLFAPATVLADPPATDNSASASCILNNKAEGFWQNVYEVFKGLLAEQRKSCCLSAMVAECCNAGDATAALSNQAAYNPKDVTDRCQIWARNCQSDVSIREVRAPYENSEAQPSHCAGLPQ